MRLVRHCLSKIFKNCQISKFCSLFFRHVQINNEGAIKFYERHGFEIVEEKKNYYKRIEPADAYVLQKTFKADADSKSKEEKKESQWQSIK